MAKVRVSKEAGEEGYRFFLTAPDGMEGDIFEYGELATVRDGDDIYLCQLDGPHETPQVEKVTETEVVACDTDSVEIQDEEEEEEQEEEGPETPEMDVVE